MHGNIGKRKRRRLRSCKARKANYERSRNRRFAARFWRLSSTNTK